ncbi:Protein FAR-RED ELONGATED HYPOCOTYL 3 [Bienertia sinuspersici]
MSGDLEFFFRVRVDGYGRVSSIFWRDSMMKEDYNIYGDVTIFDTSYRTNRHFEQEFEASMTSEVTKCSVIGNMLLYEVRIEDNNNTTEQVTYIQNDETITCTCKCFEETGLLCYHAIRILHGNLVKRIPEKYILSRWTKFAKKEVWDKVEAQNMCLHMARKFYNLILKSHTNEQARKIMEDSYTANLLAIDALLSVESTEQIEDDMEQENSEKLNNNYFRPSSLNNQRKEQKKERTL